MVFLSRRGSGILLMIISSLCFTTSYSIIKVIGSNTLPVSLLVGCRNLFFCFFSIPVFFYFGYNKILLENLKYYFFGGTSNYLCLMSIYYIYGKLSFIIAMLIIYTEPVLQPLIVAIIGRGKIDIKELSIIILGFIGIVIVLLGNTNIDQQKSGEISLINVTVALFAVLMICFRNIATRQLTHTESSHQIIAIFSFISLLMNIPLFLYDFSSLKIETYTMQHSLYIILLMLCTSLLAFLGHYFQTKAFSYEAPEKLLSLRYLNIVYIILLGSFLFGEKITWHLLLGGGIIIVSNIVLLASKRDSNIN